MNENYLLPVGTLIGNGKYQLEKCLGAGGFGITYLGYDVRLNRRVAVKEFFMEACCFRQAGDLNVYVMDNQYGSMFYRLRDEFVKEAQILAKLDEQPGVVRVITYEEENQTAYIIMDFVEGNSLTSYVAQRGGFLTVQTVLDVMKPVIQALAGIHQKQVVHRDISPDNIMITKDNRVKLIDFGAARTSGEYNESKVAKGGYTPIEQKTRDGQVGTYTDIYALCATIYKCITGQAVPESKGRAMQDTIIPPSAFGIQISPKQEETILAGLAVYPEQRIQNAADLYYRLYVEDSNMIQPTMARQKTTDAEATYLLKRIELEQKHERKRSNTLTIMAVILAIAVFAIVYVVINGPKNNSGNQNPTAEQVVDNKFDAQDSTNPGQDVEVKEVDLEEYKNKLYNQIVAERGADAPTLYVDDTLTAAAKYCSNEAAALTYTDVNDLNAQLSELGTDTLEKFKIPSVSWVITGLNLEYDVAQVKQSIDAQIKANNDVQNGIFDLENCTNIGIGLARAEDGMFYWTIIFN